jgi:hypothetical protein
MGVADVGDRARGRERAGAAQQVEQRRTQRIDVAGRPRRLAEPDLGRDERRRADRLARAGLAAQHGEAEVGELHLAAAGQQQVLRLDVAVDDADAVGVLESVGDRGDHAHTGVGGHGAAALDAGVEAATVDVLHRDRPHPGDPLDVVDADDARMIEGRDQPGLLDRTQVRGVVARRVEDLERDRAAQHDVAGEEDVGLAAAAQAPLDDVVADAAGPARAVGHRRSTTSASRCAVASGLRVGPPRKTSAPSSPRRANTD